MPNTFFVHLKRIPVSGEFRPKKLERCLKSISVSESETLWSPYLEISRYPIEINETIRIEWPSPKKQSNDELKDFFTCEQLCLTFKSDNPAFCLSLSVQVVHVHVGKEGSQFKYKIEPEHTCLTQLKGNDIFHSIIRLSSIGPQIQDYS